MVIIMPITKARINLGGIIKNVRLNKEYYVLEKDGYPMAGIMDIDEFEDYLDARNEKLNKQIKESFKEFKTGKTKPINKLINELKRLKNNPA